MGLEKVISKGKNFARNILCAGLVALSLTSCPNPIPPSPKYEYITTVTPVKSEYIDSSLGGTIEVDNSNSLINGTELTIPGGALTEDTTISVGEVNNPPVLPAGLNYVGTPIDLGPDGLIFSSLTIKIPYSDSSLSDAGVSDDSNLGLSFYDKSSSTWNEAHIISIDRENNIITAELNHFSYYEITCFNANIPEDLGTPQPGDLLYSLGAVWDQGNPKLKDNWLPGHVGIYVGEKIYSKGAASEEVKKNGKYNVIEAMGDISTMGGIVRYHYCNPLTQFSGLDSYAGAREPKDFTLTQEQREDIVEYAEAQIGKPYAFFETIGVFFGLARGSLVKGPGSFNCVGLAEAAYEYAGVNGGDGLVSWWDEDWPPIEQAGIFSAVLTPAEQYNKTKPALGIIGQRGPAGGWIFYDKGTYSDGWRFLEAAPNDQASSTWGANNIIIPGADGELIGTGKQNTIDILTGDSAVNKAADKCADYVVVNGGIVYDDWFLPSLGELNKMGLNLYNRGIGNFTGNIYWSSSEYRNKGTTAWCTYFDAGISTNNYKTYLHSVRAIRNF